MPVHSLRAMTSGCTPLRHCAELFRQATGAPGPGSPAVLRAVLHYSLSTIGTPFAMERI